MDNNEIALFSAIGTWLAAIATIAAAIAAVYNARIAMNIATREKKHEVRVFCDTGLYQYVANEDGVNYVRAQPSTSSYKYYVNNFKTEPVLEIRIDNVGELPVRIEGIFFDLLDQKIHLNALDPASKADLIYHTIDVGMTSEPYLYPFEKIAHGANEVLLYQAASMGMPIVLCVQTNFRKLFYTDLPIAFIDHIRELGSAASNSQADA